MGITGGGGGRPSPRGDYSESKVSFNLSIQAILSNFCSSTFFFSTQYPVFRYLGEQRNDSRIDGAVLVSQGFDMEVKHLSLLSFSDCLVSIFRKDNPIILNFFFYTSPSGIGSASRNYLLSVYPFSLPLPLQYFL